MAEYKLSYTGAEVNEKLGMVDTLSSQVSSLNIPTKVSELTNDSGFLTSVPSEYVTESELNAKGYALQSAVDSINEEIADLPNNEELVEKVAEKVPYVKVVESPEPVNSTEEMVDKNKLYLLGGKVYGYKKKEITTEGGTKPNFTNLLEAEGAYTKAGYRYSNSSLAWKEYEGGTSYVVPIPRGTVTLRIKNFSNNGYQYLYGGTTNDEFPYSFSLTSGAGSMANFGSTDLIEITFENTAQNYATFYSKDGVVEVVTANEEITYTTTEGGTQVVEDFMDLGISYNQPADYENRVIANENAIEELESDTAEIKEQLNNLESNSSGSLTNVTTVFSTPAYAPVPQLPADGSNGSDFNHKTVTTQDAYDYMDALCDKYTQYITKQTMGKDASGEFDHNRYILCKSYWRAWQKENYPKMYAWKNGDTVIYSVSVSPRVGDTMYSTPYVGTAYETVTSVNCTAGTLSTRTVNNLVFERYSDGDIEPTVVYTKPPVSPGGLAISQAVYDSSFTSLTKVSTVGEGSFVGGDGNAYTRYPFEDRKVDKSKPMSIFILSNEHGLNGDDLIPSFVVMRMAKDLCKNTDNPFLKWMKENCTITMIPVGSPWGYARYLESSNTSGYYNSNGVNINRNYDTPGWATSDTNYGDVETFGEYAGCESETQHIMNTMRLCKPAVGISMHSPGFDPQYKDMPDNAYFIYQGQGFDSARVHKILEALYSNYSMCGSASINSAQHYNNCGKSPAYIQYVGAVGGLTETVPQEVGTNNTHTPMAMEQAYTQLLLFLQTWCEEALEKNS